MNLTHPDDFLSVTETVGEPVTNEQIERITNRYEWGAGFCSGKDVLEIACGTGQGLGILEKVARSVSAGDVSPKMVGQIRDHYKNRIDVQQMDALHLPFENQSKDVILIFEAIYYLPDIGKFIQECRRVLRPQGVLLITTANKDLFDFNPSPYSHQYYGVVELTERLTEAGFSVECLGDTPVGDVSLRQKMLRPAKRIARDFGLIPKTMAGKRLLKRIVFGKLEPMPAELDGNPQSELALTPLDGTKPDTEHKVIFCVARRREDQ